jgi:hypothetical protein
MEKEGRLHGFMRFFIPVIEVLKELGGSGRSAERRKVTRLKVAIVEQGFCNSQISSYQDLTCQASEAH